MSPDHFVFSSFFNHCKRFYCLPVFKIWIGRHFLRILCIVKLHFNLTCILFRTIKSSPWKVTPPNVFWYSSPLVLTIRLRSYWIPESFQKSFCSKSGTHVLSFIFSTLALIVFFMGGSYIFDFSCFNENKRALIFSFLPILFVSVERMPIFFMSSGGLIQFVSSSKYPFHKTFLK